MSIAAPIVAVDLGGTRCRVALLDVEGNILDCIREDTRSEEGPDRLVERIVQDADTMLRKGGFPEPIGAGVAVAGPVDRHGVIHNPPNLVGWKTVPFKAMLQQRFAVPVWLGNDANVACLGEHLFGSARGVNDFIYMTVSTGVGGGVLSGGQLVTGWKGLGAEVGHIIIDRNGPTGQCGHVGCLESLVSGTSIARIARDGLSGGEESSLRETVGGDLGRVRAEHVFRAAAAGDRFSSDLVTQVAWDLAMGIVSLVHVFNPKMLILGGGVSRDWHMLLLDVSRAMRQQTFPEFKEGFEITVSALGDDVGLVGGAALVLLESGAATG